MGVIGGEQPSDALAEKLPVDPGCVAALLTNLLISFLLWSIG